MSSVCRDLINLARRLPLIERAVLKIIGAAAQRGWTLEQCVETGNQCNAHMVTVGTSLDHCHIPGREHHEHVPENACVLGMGIHNEPVSFFDNFGWLGNIFTRIAVGATDAFATAVG